MRWLSLIRQAPDRCAFCGYAGEKRRICRRCIDILPWNNTVCSCCGQPVVGDLPDGVSCAYCQKNPPPFEKARSPLHYAFPVDTALKAMKFQRQLFYVPAFVSLLEPVQREEFGDCDALVPVPLHRWRYWRRGFNQASELSHSLAAVTGLPVIDRAVRVRATKTQSGLSSAERRVNLRGAFAVESALGARYPLVIDDVLTTGMTAGHLAMVLLEAGAERVGVLTVARASLSA